MGILDQVSANLLGALGTILPFLFVLTVVVFIHELGHFLVARWCGVRVTTFSIGFGREIAGFNDRHGTRWRIAWIPLGGYVKFMDDENGASMPSREMLERMTPAEREGSFHAKPLWQRAAVVAAGPIANFILAVVILAGLYMSLGMPIMAPRIDDVVEGGAAQKAGFKPGDIVLAVDGAAIESFSDMQRRIGPNAGRELTFLVDRGGVQVTLKATPATVEQSDGFGGKMRMGVIGIKRSSTPQDWRVKTFGPIDAVSQAVQECYFIAARSLAYMRDVILRRESPDQLGGPIRIADVSGKVATLGLAPLLNLMAVISVSIGLLNLFPIPLLDGGHLLFYGIEAIRRKPLSERTQEIGFRIGLAFVVMLMVFATWNDLGILQRWIKGAG
jgi:regulator of sigma E protease